MRFRTVAPMVSLALIMGLVVGCSTSPEPGVTAKWTKLETQVQGNPEEVVEIANNVLSELDLFIISSSATQLNGRVIARSGTDRRLTVNLRNMGENRTEVSLQGAGGMFRESGLGVSILNEIRDRAQSQQSPTQQSPGEDAGALLSPDGDQARRQANR